MTAKTDFASTYKAGQVITISGKAYSVDRDTTATGITMLTGPRGGSWALFHYPDCIKLHKHGSTRFDRVTVR